MGLDMYLTRKTYVKRWDHIKPEDQFSITVTRGGKPYPLIDTSKITYIEEEVGYWRKASAIHAWFVREVQEDEDDCREYYVGKDDLRKLLMVVGTVLAHQERALELLPPPGGFFFGTTDLDDWYWDNLKLTRTLLKEVLESTSDDQTLYYRSSW